MAELTAELSRARSEAAAISNLSSSQLRTLASENEAARTRIVARLEEVSRAERCCSICMDLPKDTVLVPCGHLYCRTCAASISTCAECRMGIEQRVRAYL